MSKPSLYGKLQFCPRCGVRGLKRDYYDGGNSRQGDLVEYACEVCHFGFRVLPSRRGYIADQLHQDHRSVRIGSFHENVTEQARKEFERNNPEPWKFKLWRLWRRVKGIEQDTNTHARAKDPEKKLV